MKKFILLVTLVMAIFTACRNVTYVDEEIYGKFIVLSYDKNKEAGTNWYGTYTVYDRDTKAMYYIIDGYSKGGIVPIYNEDGTVKFYDVTNL